MRKWESLRPWVQEQHLRPESYANHRQEFCGHPARLTVFKNFLQRTVAEQLSCFLDTEAEFQIVYGLYSHEGSGISAEEWLTAAEKDQFFRFSRIAGVPPQLRLSPNAFTFLRFRKALQDDIFTEFFGSLTGLPLRWSNNFASHALKAGDFLKVHDDNGKERQLAVLSGSPTSTA